MKKEHSKDIHHLHDKGYKDLFSKKEIAALLHKSERTIRREINRGKIVIRGYNWDDKEER